MGEMLARRLGVENLYFASSTGSGKRGSFSLLDLREWIPLPVALFGVMGVSCSLSRIYASCRFLFCEELRFWVIAEGDLG